MARRLAKKILSGARAEKPFILAMAGDLGSGKTTFLQGFAAGLGLKEKILSPTFVIFKKFQIPRLAGRRANSTSPVIAMRRRCGREFQTNFKSQTPKFNNLYHIDCYRIQNPKEILALGFKNIISDPKNIIAIEWSERIKNIIPVGALRVSFEHRGPKKRRIIFHSPKRAAVVK